MSALVQRGSVQGRTMALAIVIALHVALVAGLMAIKAVDVLKADYTAPIQYRSLEPEHKPIPQVKPIEPVLGKPAMPTPVVNLQHLVFEDTSIQVVAETRPDTMPKETQVVTESRAIVPDTPLRFQAVRPADDYYPPQAIRMAVEGATVVRACVDARGVLSGTPTVVDSSRQSLLDAAAVKWAGEALRFQPATQGGVAIASCKEFRVSFTLH